MTRDLASVASKALEGEVIVVTGAGRGIGREVARAAARLGAAVCIAEVSLEGRDVAEGICAEGGEAVYVQTDVGDSSSVDRFAQTVLDAYGRVDVLINNAAALSVKPLNEVSREEWERILAVNLTGAFAMIRAFLPGMLRRGHGTVVTMESAEGMPYLAPYLATKAGLRSLAMSLALEVGPESGVSVYCFGPGIVETEGLLDAFRELAPRYGRSFEEFAKQSGLPLISAELCAAGLVGTLVTSADHHGSETTYVEGLASLGLGPDGELRKRPAAQDDGSTERRRRAPHAGARGRGDAAEVNRELERILATYAEEFSQLNTLMRPVAKRMFRRDTGATIESWVSRARDVTRALEADATERDLGGYGSDLGRLAGHIAKQEAQVPAWIKDPELLEQAIDSLRHRRRTVERLASLLG